MKSSETEFIFNKFLNDDLNINNANISLLSEFTTIWTDAAYREGILLSFIQNWFKRAHLLHKLNKVNHVTRIMAIFLLEKTLNKIDLDTNEQYCCAIVQIFLSLHEMITSAYLNDLTDIASCNDAVIAFFRLHCKLSKKREGLRLIKKYNLWKQLLNFYIKSNKFNFLIQNTCTEYVNNLISAEIPDDISSLLDVVHITMQYIKSAAESNQYCNQVLFRSIRILLHVLSNNLTYLKENSLHIISKHCHSLLHYICHLLITCKDSILVCLLLKIYILLKCFFLNTGDQRKNPEVFKRFIMSVHEVINENSEFNEYIPEIFNIDFKDIEWQVELQTCFTYLRITTILVYMEQLSVTVNLEEFEKQLQIPEEFKPFFELYQSQLQKETHLSTIVDNILKNVCGMKNLLKINIFFINAFNTILKSISHGLRKNSDELSVVCMNIINALTSIISNEEEFHEHQSLIRDLLKTMINMADIKTQFEVILRLSALRLCHTILPRLEEISCEDVDLLRHAVVNGLNDSCWEIRDSALELLNGILSHINCTVEWESILSNTDVCQSLLKSREDEESCVRASAYSVLVVSVIAKKRLLWEMHLNYEDITADTIRQFATETESNVKENMITFIFEIWHSYKISDTALTLKLYETIFQASHNDLISEVRRNGMLFWYSLVQKIKHDYNNDTKQDTITFLVKLGYVGCLQAVDSGVEDEYDYVVIETALSILRYLKSFSLSAEDFSNWKATNVNVENDNEQRFIESSSDVDFHLLNKLPTVVTTKTEFVDAETFVMKYNNIDVDEIIEHHLSRGNVFDLKNLLECFEDNTCTDSEINQKDCY